MDPVDSAIYGKRPIIAELASRVSSAGQRRENALAARSQSVAQCEMVREVVAVAAVSENWVAYAAGVFEEQRGGKTGRRRAIAMETVGPVLLFPALRGGPVAIGECPQVLRIHSAIVLAAGH